MTGFLFLFFQPGPAFAVQAPDFSATDIAGRIHRLEDYRGKYLVLYFWATWCPACREDIPHIKEMYQRYQPQGVSFLTVSLDRDRVRLETFAESHALPYPVLFDGKVWDAELARLFGIRSTPSFVLVDPDGRIVDRGGWIYDIDKTLSKI